LGDVSADKISPQPHDATLAILAPSIRVTAETGSTISAILLMLVFFKAQASL